MTAITTCLKKFGAGLSAQDRKDLQAILKDYKDDGMKAQDAARAALADMIDMVMQERAGLEEQVVAAGGVMPTAPVFENANPLDETYGIENADGVVVGGVPGTYGWSFDKGSKPPAPIQAPSQLGPNVQRMADAVNKIFKTTGFKKLIKDAFGVDNLKAVPTAGSWGGKSEPSFVLEGDGLAGEVAIDLAKMLGFAFAQDAMVVRKPTYVSDNDSTTPVLIIGQDKKLSPEKLQEVIDLAAETGLDYTTSKDGKAVEFLYFGNESGILDFSTQVKEIGTKAGLSRFGLYHTKSELIEAKDYGSTSESYEGNSVQAWLQGSAERRSDLFTRTVDHVLVPYARAVAGEGFRFSSRRFAEKFGLSKEQEAYIKAALRPKSGSKISTANILYGDEQLDVDGTVTKSGPNKGKKNSSVLQMLWSLQNRAASNGQIDPDDYSNEAQKIIADAIADEIIGHINQPEGKSAIGWYDRALKKAKKIYDKVFPSIHTSKNQALLFDAFLGITSQGMDVHTNSKNAGRMFQLAVVEGKGIPEAVKILKGTFGKETNAVEGNLLKLHELIARNGYDRMRKFFNKKGTVSSFNAELRSDETLFYNGSPLSVEGKAEQTVNGWMVFGPKIGSFINNLHGDYSTLTADLWFTRTWNRLLGYSFVYSNMVEADKYQAFANALYAEYNNPADLKSDENIRSIAKNGNKKYWELGNDVTNMSEDTLTGILDNPNAMLALAEELHDLYKRGDNFIEDPTNIAPKDRKGYSFKSDLRRAAKNWIEYRSTAQAAPRNDSERHFQQLTMESARKVIKRKTGQTIEIADMQAALWYHEKDLFKKFGVGDDKAEAADYADAAENMMESYNAGNLFINVDPKTGKVKKVVHGKKGYYINKDGSPKFTAPVFSPRQGQGNAKSSEPAGPPVRGSDERNRLDQEAVKRLGFALRSGVELADQAVPDTLSAAVDAIEETFGRRVALVQKTPGATEELPFNGAVLPSLKDVLFANIDSDAPIMAVIGHETLHKLRQDHPDLYDAVVDVIIDYANITPEKFDAFAKFNNDARRREGAPELTLDEVMEEFAADAFGDSFNDPKFWERVSKNNPSAFKRIADLVIKWLNSVLNKMRGNRKLRGTAVMDNFETIRDQIADILSSAEFARDLQMRQAATNNPAFNPNAPIYYSELEKEIDAIKSKQQPANNWKNQIKKMTTKGVKQEELDWSGVIEWLDGLGMNKVTKEELQQYLASQRVHIDEVARTGAPEDGNEDAVTQMYVDYMMERTEIDYDPDEGGYVFVDENGEVMRDYGGDVLVYGDEDDARAELQYKFEEESRAYSADQIYEMTGQEKPVGLPTKFQNWSIPGEKYTELLLTLPNKKTIVDKRPMEFGDLDNLPEDQQNRILDTLRETGEFPEITTYNEVETEEYSSGHWEEANVVAHVRHSEQTTADGKKVLLIDEIQSDWHQAGRKKGYAMTPAEKKQKEAAWKKARESFYQFEDSMMQKYEDAIIEMGDMGYARGDTSVLNFVMSNEDAVTHGQLFAQMQGTQDYLVDNGVPNAPFKKTETWAMLAFKRMLRHAAENGYDQIVWTPGEVQAERYDLSKQIDSITVSYSHINPENYNINAQDSGGRDVMTESNLKDTEVEDYIGKDLASKALESLKESGNRAVTLKDADLKVGGEGMIGFYDKLLPKAVNKYLKKWGVKVGVDRLRPDDFETGIVAQMKDDATAEGQEVWSIPVTDEMKASVLGGQPMFTPAWHGSPHDHDKFMTDKIGTGEGAQAYGWGLYFASARGVAEFYRNGLSPSIMTKRLVDAGVDPAVAQMVSNHISQNGYSNSSREEAIGMLKAIDTPSAEQLIQSIGGKLYQVELAPAEDEYLLWDKPLSEQSEKVSKLLEGEDPLDYNKDIRITKLPDGKYNLQMLDPGSRFKLMLDLGDFDTYGEADMRAMEIYREMSPQEQRVFNTDGAGLYTRLSRTLGSDKAASEYLHSLGIRGIKYLDGSSRSQGTLNAAQEKSLMESIKRAKEDLALAKKNNSQAMIKFWEDKIANYNSQLDDLRSGLDYNYVIFNDEDVSIQAKFSPRQTEGMAVERELFSAPDQLTTGDKFMTKIIDKYQSLVNIQKAIKAGTNQENLAEDVDAELALIGYPGKTRAVLDDFERDYVEPLKEVLRRTSLSMGEIGKYMHALHAAEANAVLKERNPDRENNEALSGMTDQEAAAIIEQYQNNPEMQLVRGHLKAINQLRLNLLVESELVTPAEAAAWMNNYQNYIPLNREEVSTSMPARGSGFDVRGKESKVRVGSATREVDHDNLVARILAQYEATAVRAEKNKVAQTIYNLASQYPNPDLWVVDELPTTPRLKADGTADQVPTAFRNNVISAKFNGESKYVTLTENNDHAVALSKALKNMDGTTSRLLGPLLTLNRYLSAINTSLSPEFVISNFFRDIQTAAYNLTDTEVKDLEVKTIKQVPAALRGIKKALRDQDYTGEYAQLFEEFRKAGGMTGWMQAYDDIGGRMSALKRQIKYSKMPGVKQAAEIFGFIEDYNTIVENGVRLATYKSAKDIGLSNERAARIAKEITVNFNSKGEWGTNLNALYLFFNASVQGSARLIRAVADPRNTRVRKFVGATVAAAAILDVINRMISFDDDDDEVSKYDQIPSHIKDRNLILMDVFGATEDGYFKFPLPWGYNVFHVLGQEIGGAVSAATGHNPNYTITKSGSRMISSVLDAFNPVQSGTFLQTIAPTALDIPVMILENKAWHGGPLMPDYNQSQPDYQKYYANVSPAAKWVTDSLAKLTTDDQTLSPMIDWSPEWLEAGYDFLTGSVGRLFSDAAQLGTRVMDGSLEMKNVPIFRKLYGNLGESDRQAYFYDKYFGLLDTQSRLNKIKTEEGGQAYSEAMKRIDPKRLKMMGVAKATKKQLTSLKKAIKEAEKAGKTDVVDKLKEKKMQTIDNFVKRYHTEMFGEL